jgi:hypothetical protein
MVMQNLMRAVLAVSMSTALVLAAARGERAGAQEQPTKIVVTNNTGSTLSYRYRTNYNDGKGGKKRYVTITHKDGSTLALPAMGHPQLDYGIVVRFPDDGRWCRLLFASLGPYEFRKGALCPITNSPVIEIYDAKGTKVPLTTASD